MSTITNEILDIGLDIDGPLLNTDEVQLEDAKKFFLKKGIKVKNENGYGIKEIYDVDAKEEKSFWTYYTFKKSLQKPAREDFVKELTKLKNEGKKIHIITSRAKCSENNLAGKVMRTLTKIWLKKNKIKYDSITFCSTKNSSQEKKNICQKLGIDVMIEDYTENINAISKVSKVICVKTKNNESEKFAENVKLVSTGEEMYSQVQNVYKQKLKVENFKVLNRKEREGLSNQELKEYFINLKNHYISLPFDKVAHQKKEKQCAIAMSIMGAVFKVVYNPRIIKTESYDLKNSIIVSNHLHSFDPLMIKQKAYREPFNIVAKKGISNSMFGKLFNYIGAVFIDKDDSESIEKAKIESLKICVNGGTLMEFPEGTRFYKSPIEKRKEHMSEISFGTVDKAQKLGIPIIPYAVTDEYKAFRPFNRNLIAKQGKPYYVEYNKDLKLAKEELENIMVNLILDVKSEKKNDGDSSDQETKKINSKTKSIFHKI